MFLTFQPQSTSHYERMPSWEDSTRSMQPPEEPSLHRVSSSLKSPGKRKQSEQHSSPSSNGIRQPTLSGSSWNTAAPSQPPDKRLKTSHSAQNLGPQGNMSKIMRRGSQTEIIDLTKKPSNFQPHTGTKRLVIKNLRVTAKEDVDRYYEKTWDELDTALTAVFNRQQPSSPLEILCRGVEAICRRGRAEQLAGHLEERCKTYLEKQLLPQVLIQAGQGSSVLDALRTVHRFWTQWDEQSTLIRSIFSYLDRSYLLNSKQHQQLETQGINLFRHTVFHKATKSSESVGSRALSGVCELVSYDRSQDERFDTTLLKDSIFMLHILGIYMKKFEWSFLQLSKDYFKSFTHDRSNSSLREYTAACDKLLSREALRCDTYNFESTTKRSLLDQAHKTLIEDRTNILLESSGLAKLIDSNAVASLKILYDLLCLSKIQRQLKEPWETYIKAAGSAIVSDKEKVEDMVLRLLELKRSLDIIIRDSFNKDEEFTYGLREAFGNFINDRNNTKAWGTSNSKVGEMIAKYIDMLLRGGLKAVPRSLVSDAIDRDEAEKKGQASTGDEDAELDRQLDNGLELFRFIEGKDVFEAFYKKDLARRLLMSRSASQDAERNMLAKLKTECGFSFTHNLEQMFKDQELARDEMSAYKQMLGDGGKAGMDLQVNVLSAAAWPTYPDVKVNIPTEIAKHIERYDRHYKHKHTGRKLSWKHSLAHSIVRAKFNKSTKELLVSAFQAIVLVLFNDLEAGGNLSYTDIAAATGLVDAELQRTLQSLACAKIRILTKHPKGRDVNPTDTFTVNAAFTDPKYRIKINQIQLKETKEENKETHERVQQDRQYETQAAIVRIMKSRKAMTHGNLVAEVINQTKGRGAVEMGEIKKNIEKLIEKDYIEREGSSYVYLA